MMRATVMASVALAGCAHGNIRSEASYRGPKPPPVRHPLYDPYASYGAAPATWRPAVAAREGTIIKPSDPADQSERPDYEHATWSTNSLAKNDGTF